MTLTNPILERLLAATKKAKVHCDNTHSPLSAPRTRPYFFEGRVILRAKPFHAPISCTPLVVLS